MLELKKSEILLDTMKIQGKYRELQALRTVSALGSDGSRPIRLPERIRQIGGLGEKRE